MEFTQIVPTSIEGTNTQQYREFEGKVIAAVERRACIKTDDVPFIDIWFTDDTMMTIMSVADDGNYTGKSMGEYPQHICILEEGSYQDSTQL